MKKCIVKYNDNLNYKCWCNHDDSCSNCSIKDNRSDNTCKVSPNGFCTCRKCGERKIKE